MHEVCTASQSPRNGNPAITQPVLTARHLMSR